MPINQKGALSYLIGFLVVIALISGFLFFRKNVVSKPSDSMKLSEQSASVDPRIFQTYTYTNSKYGFSVKYPGSLVVREFPDSGDGAGFRPIGTSDDPANEVITVSVLQKNADLAQDPLSEYAKVAASVQIQNYQKLNSISPIQTDSGLTGYKTTWDVLPMAILGASPSAQTSVSLPITYFDLKDASSASTVQVSLDDDKFEREYDQIIKSYSTE